MSRRCQFLSSLLCLGALTTAFPAFSQEDVQTPEQAQSPPEAQAAEKEAEADQAPQDEAAAEKDANSAQEAPAEEVSEEKKETADQTEADSTAEATDAEVTASEGVENRAAEVTAEGEAASQTSAAAATPEDTAAPADTTAEAAPETATGPSRSASARPEPSEDSLIAVDDKGEAVKEEKMKRFVLGVMVDLSIPVGNTAGFIGNASLQGFSVDLRYYITENIGVGIGAAFDTLSKKKTGTFVWDELTVDSVHTRQQTFTPLLAKAYYAFRGEKTSQILPYVAVGAGTARSAQRVLTGVSSMSRDTWHFAVAPEVGAHISVASVVLIGAARLNYLPATGKSEAQTLANFSVGVAIQ